MVENGNGLDKKIDMKKNEIFETECKPPTGESLQ